MTRFDILFETDHFNLSEVREHFHQSMLLWRRPARMAAAATHGDGVTATLPFPEDWGWELFAQQRLQSCFLGVTGCLREPAVARKDGAWRIMVEKKRSIWDKLQGKNAVNVAEPILAVVGTILPEHTEIGNVRCESIPF